MLLALISDIHANDLALQACLRHCAALGVGRIVVLGDIVGYGAEPEATVRRVSGLVEAGAIVVLGNHDQAIDTPSVQMNETARRAIAWTRPRLSETSRAFLRGLPLTCTLDNFLFVHADASAPAKWKYVTGAAEARISMAAVKARVTFCGHTHVPMLYCLTAAAKAVAHGPSVDRPVPLLEQRQWLAVIGAAGQPRDGNPAAAFATFDTVSRELTFRRAPYNVEAAAAKLRAAGLPEALALRLLQGK